MDNETLKSQQIESIYNANWKKFLNWSQNNKLQLDIPEDIAQVLIPKRLMELVADPERLNVIVYGTEPYSLQFIVVERLNSPISDEGLLARYIAQYTPFDHPEPTSASEVPSGIDYQHIRNYDLIYGGYIGLNDKVHIRCAMMKSHKDSPSVEVVRYDDRSEMQRMGIGTSFYERMNGVLKQLDFKYQYGDIHSPHPQFFTKDRVRYSDLPETVKTELPPILRTSPRAPRIMVKTL